MIFEIILTVILSLAIGLLMGVIGGGGGGIYVVALLLFLHQDAKTAAVTALVLSTITLSGAAWQYWKNGQVKNDYFIIFTVLDVAGTLIGNLIMRQINEFALRIVILAVLLLISLGALIKVGTSSDNATPTDAIKKLPVITPVGLISGLITGTTGLSGGTMLSSLLIGLFEFSPYQAIGTTTLIGFTGNLVSIIIMGLSDVIAHTSALPIDYETLLTLGIGSAVGAIFGAKLATKINRKALTIMLSLMTALPGLYFLIKK